MRNYLFYYLIIFLLVIIKPFIQLNPKDANAWSNKGILLNDLGR